MFALYMVCNIYNINSHRSKPSVAFLTGGFRLHGACDVSDDVW